MTRNTPATIVTNMQFVPVKPNGGHIGFVSFVVDHKWYIGSVAVYTRLDGHGIRLVYPKKNQINCVHPISRVAGDAVTSAVVSKLNELPNSYFHSDQNVYEELRAPVQT